MSVSHRDIPELADEYVLGLLEPSEQEAVEARLERDAALKAAVAESRDRFLALDLAGEPAGIADALWSRIDDALPERTGEDTSAAPPGAPASAANDNALRLWRLGAIAAMAACLVLAIGLGWSVTTRPAPQVVAVLINDAGEAQAIVEDYGDRSARVVLLTDFAVPEDKTLQVWTLPSQEMGPVSLGILKERRTALLHGPDLPRPHRDQLYEITVEQAGGSPVGRPTGPILVKGYARLPR